MTQSAAAVPRTETTIFQRRLIPESSEFVGRTMQKAAVWGNSENFFVSRLGTIALAIAAIAMSAINTISYGLGIPIQVLQNIVALNPKRLVFDFAGGFFNVARSLLFITLGPTLILGGLLIPSQIFSYFAPEYVGSEIDRVKRENSRLATELAKAKEEIGKVRDRYFQESDHACKLEVLNQKLIKEKGALADKLRTTLLNSQSIWSWLKRKLSCS
ncbi:MAG: hypothetical protein KR126chlam1_01229 [Chlamydiae bacterium]|nr:hypothetical protein [Chlamydiota bacterium]